MKSVVSLDRRPVSGRENSLVLACARLLLRIGLRPNHVSLISVLFSLVAALSAVALSKSLELASLGIVVVCVVGRLLCNLIDGIMAIEGGYKTSIGALFNDFPDRVSDSLILIAFGYTAGIDPIGNTLGWACALVAALTAYIRAYGGACGAPQDFSGPMAKQHRMFVIIGGCCLAAAEALLYGTHWSLLATLVVILSGGILTCILRTKRLAEYLQSTV